MNTAAVTFVIYFVGIAAFEDHGPDRKLVVFPVARGGEYHGLKLADHTAFLHLRREDLVDPDVCTANGGKWNAAETICSIELRGAKLSVDTTQKLVDDTTKMPRLGNLCPGKWKPKPKYNVGTDPSSVAARFEITGGTATGCNRRKGAYVTRLKVTTTDGVLELTRGGKPLRIPLKGTPALSIENRPDADAHTHRAAKEHPEHYGWYYFIADGPIDCRIKIPAPADQKFCGDIPGVVDPPIHVPSASGPDCGNTGYP